MPWIRISILALGVLAGVLFSQLIPGGNDISHGMTVFSLGLAGALSGFLLAPRLERRILLLAGKFRAWYASLSPRTVAAATVGLVVALLLSVLLNTLLTNVPFYSWVWNLLLTLVLSVFFVAFALRNVDAFGIFAWTPAPRETPPPTAPEPEQAPQGGKFLDTNVIIDGRILALVKAGFLEGELVVPAFVLREVQFLADHGEPQKRARGKRGLTVLDELRQIAPLRIDEREAPEVEAVDEKLVRLARESGAKLLTNDSNLSKIAKLYGVPVLSLHEAAVALRPQLQPGDVLSVNITKGGQQAGQGVGYLEDGTMIVVEDGAKYRGRTTRVVVVNNMQTNVGRMVFTRPDTNPVDN